MSKIAIIFRVSRIFLCIFDSFKTQIEVKKTPDNFGNHHNHPGISLFTYIQIGFSLYFSIRRLSPVMSAGCSIPISWISVGMMSARHPFSLKVYFGSAFTRINGTGFVV